MGEGIEDIGGRGWGGRFRSLGLELGGRSLVFVGVGVDVRVLIFRLGSLVFSFRM